jgi:hypothetical protein
MVEIAIPSIKNMKRFIEAVSGIFTFIGTVGIISGLIGLVIFGIALNSDSNLLSLISGSLPIEITFESSIEGVMFSLSLLAISAGFLYSGMQLFATRFYGLFAGYLTCFFSLIVYVEFFALNALLILGIMATNTLLTVAVWTVNKS